MEIREIPFLAMGGIYEEDDLAAVTNVVRAALDERGSFFPLPEESDFQNALARHEAAEKAIVVNSCGTALDCCMMALGIGPGDEVITTGLTFVCTAGTAIARGAKVVFADILPQTLNINPGQVLKKITKRTKAIIPVHFAGLPCDLDALEAISAEKGVPIIYDAAHAIGAKYRARPIGGYGKASCYSFQSNKNMTCLGEGGAVTTNDPEFAEKIRQLKTFGYVYGKQLKVASIGFNYRMTKAQCAVGITQLAKIDRVNEMKRRLMIEMNRLLSDIPEIIGAPEIGPEHGCHIHVVRLDSSRVKFTASAFTERLKNVYGVATAKHYPAVWQWDAIAELGYNGVGCPETEKACSQVFTLPIFPRTKVEDLAYIAWAIKQTIFDLKK